MQRLPTGELVPVPPPAPGRFNQANWLSRWDGAAVNSTACIRGLREIFDASNTYWAAFTANVKIAVETKELGEENLERLDYVKSLRVRYKESEGTLYWLDGAALFQVMRWFKECFLVLQRGNKDTDIA
ncbi:hypothetical protein HYALB_00008240 [Hymenoscyphus albidus]|uniref:Uncharacterized protein n=1 Tax=Hymenoscyphus albidus TaxID=595503 RepID=A0A9N9LIG9_9HELO|nr:hypothetical protein HYALB_00008240 [Hymenoscyphus albidus]